MVIGINNRKSGERRVEEGILDVGAHRNQAPLQDNQVPPLQEVFMSDQVPFAPPPIRDGEIKV